MAVYCGYCDENLDDDKHETFEEHLKVCKFMTAEWAELKTLLDLVKQ